MPVLWICGAPGAGKSVTAWELFTSDAHAEECVSYLDIDQLGMLYPESEDDPEGVELKQLALAAVRANYSRLGAHFLIVSGVVDAAYSVENAHHCLLTTQPDTLRQRIMERGWSSDDADEAVREQEELIAADFADDVIDTAGLPPAEVAVRVRASFSRHCGLPSPEPRSAPSRQAREAPGVLINGPRGAGCSTVSFGLAQRRWQSGVPTGFLDLDQLSFARTPGRAEHIDLDLGLVNVATMRGVFSKLGAHDVIVNAHLTTAEDLRQIRRWNATTVVRLSADPRTIADHLLERRGGNDARLSGDDLAAAGDDHRAAVLSLALEQQERLDELGEEDVVVDVSGRTVDDIIDEIDSGYLRT